MRNFSGECDLSCASHMKNAVLTRPSLRIISKKSLSPREMFLGRMMSTSASRELFTSLAVSLDITRADEQLDRLFSASVLKQAEYSVADNKEGSHILRRM